MKLLRLNTWITAVGTSLLSVLVASPHALAAAPAAQAQAERPGGTHRLENGQPPVSLHPTVEAEQAHRARAPRAMAGFAATGGNLSYRGGLGGIGVETAPRIYLVFWGSQWNTAGDPSGEAALLQNMLTGVGGSAWLDSVVQYCQGVPSGTVNCNGSGQAAGNPLYQFAGVWWHTNVAAPKRPSQSQFAAEAVAAATYFNNTAAGSNANAQYLIATAKGYSASGFGTQYCAYHSYASSKAGYIAYTNLPYITDAGVSCGANFNGLGPKAGITIVAGHEIAEVITDPFPSTGWLDAFGSENADKCSWISNGQQGAATIVDLASGIRLPMQSLWSNQANNGAGGCVHSSPLNPVAPIAK